MAHYCCEDSDKARKVAKTMLGRDTAIFVKIMAMNSAPGVSAPNFAVVAVPELSKQQYMIAKINVFGITSCMEAFDISVTRKNDLGQVICGQPTSVIMLASSSELSVTSLN